MTDTQEINGLERLAQFRADWAALLAETPGASFFQSLDWLETYWRHFGAGQKLRVLIVSSAGRPLGILPLVVQREQTRIGRLRVLTYPLHDWGSFYGPIGPEPDAVLVPGLKHLRRGPRDWDVLELRWVDAGGPDRGRTRQAMLDAGFRGYQTIWDRTAMVDLSGTWDQYLAARPAKWRSSFRRTERRIRERGDVTYMRYRPRGAAHEDADPRWDLYGACEEIARRSWQGASTTGTTLSHDSIRPFLREVHEAAARAGAVDLNLLRLDGRPLAFAYNYHCRGQVYGLRAGYDATVSREGAGNLLLAWMIRDSFGRGDRLLDFGVGSLDSKRHFATRIAPIFRYSHFHPTALRAQLLRMKRWVQAKVQQGQVESLAAAGNSLVS